MTIWSNATVQQVRDLVSTWLVDPATLASSLDPDAVLSVSIEVACKQLINEGLTMGLTLHVDDIVTEAFRTDLGERRVVARWQPSVQVGAFYARSGQFLTDRAMPNIPDDEKIVMEHLQAAEGEVYVSAQTFCLTGWDDEARCWVYFECDD